MNPFLSRELAHEHIRDLREAAHNGGRKRREVRPDRDLATPVTVRHFAERDIDAVRLLAALDSKPMPTGAVLVAERAGEVAAAIELETRNVLADPFKPTADLVELLKLSARQLQADQATPLRWTRLAMPRGRFAA